LIRGIT